MIKAAISMIDALRFLVQFASGCQIVPLCLAFSLSVLQGGEFSTHRSELVLNDSCLNHTLLDESVGLLKHNHQYCLVVCQEKDGRGEHTADCRIYEEPTYHQELVQNVSPRKHETHSLDALIHANRCGHIHFDLSIQSTPNRTLTYARIAKIVAATEWAYLRSPADLERASTLDIFDWKTSTCDCNIDRPFESSHESQILDGLFYNILDISVCHVQLVENRSFYDDAPMNAHIGRIAPFSLAYFQAVKQTVNQPYYHPLRKGEWLEPTSATNRCLARFFVFSIPLQVKENANV